MLDNKPSCVIALGFFDSVHLGHRKVIENANEFAKNNNYRLVIFTFNGNLKATISGEKDKLVYLLDERKELLNVYADAEILSAPVSKGFLNKGRLAFLNYLNNIYNIKAYFCGQDYKFGKSGKGSVEYLKQYAQSHGQEVNVVSPVVFENKKISTTYIKKLLSVGDIEKANSILGAPYFISGSVIKDRGVGKKIGFPTINVKSNADKQPLYNGVYGGFVYVDGKRYDAVINYGNRPTFGVNDKLVEAHLIGFSGNLYGKKLKIYFSSFIRDVKKFNCVEELVSQIKKDVEVVKKK